MAEIIMVDLHCHSSASDGDHPPSYVAHQLGAAGVVWAALADHNTVAGLDSFKEAVERRGMNCIPGLEIHARTEKGPVHLLAYGFDPKNEALLNAARVLRQPWRTSARQWISRVLSLGRHAPTEDDFDGGDGMSQTPADTAEAIRLIHEAGGRAFLAHPLAGLKTLERLDAYLDWLQPQGLDGIEAFYKLYFRTTQQELAELAERRGLLTIGGSDFHGLHHSDGASPGVEIPLEQWKRFAEALGLRQRKEPAVSRAGFPVSGGSVGS